MSRASDISLATQLSQTARGTLTAADTATGDRAMVRAKRDYTALMRGVDREFQRFTAGVSGDVGDKLKSLRDGFQQALDSTMGDLSSGRIDYMTFAERMAAARMTLRHDMANAAGTTGTSGTTETTSGSNGTSVGPANGQGQAHEVDHAHGHDADHDDDGTSRGVRRASRDVRHLMRHIDRDVARFSASNTALADQASAMRDEFSKQVTKAFEDFTASGGQDYSGFAQHLAAMRREFAHSLADLAVPSAGSSGSTVTSSSGQGSTTASTGSDANATTATAGAIADADPVGTGTQSAQGSTASQGTSGAASSAQAETSSVASGGQTAQGGTGGATSTTTSGTTATTSSGSTPAERAARDRDLLLSALNGQMASLLPQLTQFPDATARYKEMSEGFRAFVQDKVDGFLKAGGTDYSSLAQELAGARMRLTSSVRAMLSGNPKIDVHA